MKRSNGFNRCIRLGIPWNNLFKTNTSAIWNIICLECLIALVLIKLNIPEIAKIINLSNIVGSNSGHPNNISDQHYLSLLYTKLLSIGRFYEQKESFKDNGGNNSFGIEVGQFENVLDIWINSSTFITSFRSSTTIFSITRCNLVPDLKKAS